MEIPITDPTVISIASVIIGFIFTVTGGVLLRRTLRFRNGVKTTGKVINIAKKNNFSTIVIQYMIANTGHAGQLTLTYKEVPAKLRLGRNVPVKYRRDHPQEAILATAANEISGIILLLAGLALWLFVIAHLLWGYQYPTA